MGWATEEFDEVNLSDKRLNARLVKLCDSFSEAPESPINQACEDWAETKAAYRFFQNENVDVGQYLVKGQKVATVYGTDVMEITVPLEDRELQWFPIPSRHGTSGNYMGPRVEVRVSFAGRRHIWEGRLVRTEGVVDKSSRMVHVIIAVSVPFDTSSGRAPLVPGMFAEVVIYGRTLQKVIAIPRHALRGGNTVWVVNDGRLYIRKVEIARSDHQSAYVVSGLDVNSPVVVSSLDVVTNGMRVRTIMDSSRK